VFASLALVRPAYSQQPAAADSKEIASYQLTSDALTKVMNINRALVQQLSQDPTMQEVVKIEREVRALEEKEQPTEMDEKRLEELRARREELEDSVDNPLSGDAKSLSEMEERIRKYPPLMQALQKEGMTPRDYAKFWLAFVQAAFVQGFKKSGMLKDLPADVSPENVAFIENHAAEIEAMQNELKALGRPK
jgi:hypothetical protein